MNDTRCGLHAGSESEIGRCPWCLLNKKDEEILAAREALGAVREWADRFLVGKGHANEELYAILKRAS